MSPRAVSSSTFLMLTALQLLFGFRGVNRWTRLVSSIRRATLSIQPKHRAWSTAADHVMLGLPEAFLCNTTPISVALSWCADSQARESAGGSNNLVFMRHQILPTLRREGVHLSTYNNDRP